MDNKMNIFKYATKELSQDAFLRWLFENWDSGEEDIKEASANLLYELIGLSSSGPKYISYVKTRAQYKGIDILVECSINQVEYIIAIEDKKNTMNHGSQLERYKKYVRDDFANKDEFIFIFYKSSIMYEREKRIVKESKWKVFDLRNIHKYIIGLNSNATHYLLKSYFEYVQRIYDSLTCELPINLKTWNLTQWFNFSLKHKWSLPTNIYVEPGNFQGKYYYIAFNLTEKWETLPYLEIRSRDISKGKLNFIIRMPNLEEEVLERDKDIFKKQVIKSSLFKTSNNKKQIGCSIVKFDISSIEELELLIDKYVNEYKTIINAGLLS